MYPRPLILAVLVLSLTTLAGGLYGLWQRSAAQGYKATAEAATRSLEQARARTERIQAQVQAVTKQRDQSRKELKDALEQNRPWADGSVPDAVSGSLCKRIRCE